MVETKKGKSLASLATGSKKTTPVKITPKEKSVEVVKTPDEIRNEKAKAKVEELLEGVSFLPTEVKEDKADDGLLYISSEASNNIDWLQEQVALLTSENEVLRNEATQAKENYTKIFNENQRIKSGGGIVDDGVLKEGVMKVFHELQSNYLKMGMSNSPRQEIIPAGEPNFRIAPAAFINRLILYFPFLQQEKRF